MSDWNQQRIDIAASRWAEGWSAARIAAEIGVSRSAVVGFAHRNRDLFPARREAFIRATRSVESRPRAPRSARPAALPRAPGRPKTERPVPPAPVPCPTGPQKTFMEAATDGLCLFFVGGHLTAAGPDMPVCGAPRAAGRYCAHHAQRATQTGTAVLEAAE
ncbi:MAG: GcrA family cell cycle regulator [Pararhodobacter sp.]